MPDPATTPAAPWRHRRVWLSAALAAQDLRACADDAAARAFIERARTGQPLVGRSAGAGDLAHWLPLGLVLAAKPGSKLRLSCCVARRSIARVAEPLRLREAMGTLPRAMRSVAERLLEFAEAEAMPLAVYGSVFWQHADAGAHLHPRSDLDLLARPASADVARRWLLRLAALDAAGPVRIDGEIELPSGDAVSWRELAAPGRLILVKSDQGPRLQERSALWAQPAPLRCPVTTCCAP